MNLLFIPSLLTGDIKGFLFKLAIVLLLWLIAFSASLVDLKTGKEASKRLGNFKTTSYGLRQTIKKDGQYFALLLVAFLFDFVFSYLTVLSDTISFLIIFSIPIFTIIGVIIVILIEWISVKENLAKGRSEIDKAAIPEEKLNLALELVSVLGDDKMKAIAEIIKSKENGKL